MTRTTARDKIRNRLEQIKELFDEVTDLARGSGITVIADTLGFKGFTLRFDGEWEVFDDCLWKSSGCTIGHEEDIVSEWSPSSWDSSSAYC